MRLNKNRIERIIRKFTNQLNYCYRHHLTTNEVVKFFGKERARQWCPKDCSASEMIKSYPDLDLINWWEKRYNCKWDWWMDD